MKKMTKKQRIDMALTGQEVDRIPVSFWRHFYEYEDTPRGLADAMLLFQENYDWDFMKVNPRASYHHEDWGANYKFFKDRINKPQRISYPVKRLSDLEKIKPLQPLKSRVLREQIDALHYIKKGLQDKVYFLMTVFTPLSILGDMTETRDTLKEYMQEDPKLVHTALESVTQTFQEFVTECLNVGISGLFFATTHWGTYHRINEGIFDQFSRPYDMRILNLVKDCPFNLLHVCKSNNMLKHLKDYPVHAFNWDSADQTNPGLGKGKEITGKTVVGGINHQKTLSEGSKEQCVEEAFSALDSTGGKSWILGAGCTFAPSAPADNLKTLREWVEQAKSR